MLGSLFKITAFSSKECCFDNPSSGKISRFDKCVESLLDVVGLLSFIFVRNNITLKCTLKKNLKTNHDVNINLRLTF